MKNKLVDLNNHLFAQLERLSEEEMDATRIDLEIRRTEAIVDVSEQIIRTAGLQLRAAELVAEHGKRLTDHLPSNLPMIGPSYEG
ncbi:hypothetical protein [Caulobacter segnis]|uniref:Phage protein n=1 Tax=Caulobacter segnis TaxID=88688 RepID=A0A2W5VD72_9CAUL|nr:hypothetical protein [Caulobacter segnis]PZR37212.1 MAG: hypothetical protein DI526_01460 [Caulobacter segnis]